MEGSCNCGSISFSISGRLPAMYQCHCSLCRRQSGAGSNAATIVAQDVFRWNRGQESIKQWQKASGFSAHFCSNCGSPVPNPLGDRYMWIPVGLLDEADRGGTRIVAQLWLDSKAHWDQPPESIRNYPAMPEDLAEFIRFLHQPQD
ncbi:GFA family protein [Motiliproteus coralliicola]|uniref:GFA family protein n=1 Tax=Motiliproteus coralliicola TaxID=2283196 RepID=A0A369WXC7_9GAMM|nr:GFA family protein [Motiliproteus coralliicola]RDE24165.1 GFA family protein [Motiliproteus coralliicola]